MKYLGFKLSNKVEDTCLDYVIKDFNCKFNIFMGDFNKIHSHLKNKLFSVYCTSFYGSHMSNFHKLEFVDVQWRKAVRKIWNVPYRTHNNLLPHICKLLPPNVLFMTRFIKYFINNFNSTNSTIRFVFRSALSNETSLGNNFRYILYKCGFNRNTFDASNGADNLSSIMIKNWKSSHQIDDIRVGNHMHELAQRRDALEPWILSKIEIQSVIDMLATA